MLISAGADVNAKDNDGITALMMAASLSTKPAVVNALLDAGADTSFPVGVNTVLDMALRNAHLGEDKALLRRLGATEEQLRNAHQPQNDR